MKYEGFLLEQIIDGEPRFWEFCMDENTAHRITDTVDFEGSYRVTPAKVTTEDEPEVKKSSGPTHGKKEIMGYKWNEKFIPQ